MQLELKPRVLSTYRSLLKESRKFSALDGDDVASSLLMKEIRIEF